MKYIVSLVFLAVIFACNNNIINEEEHVSSVKNNPIKYAKGFTISNHKNYKVITVKNVWVGDNESFRYVLYKNERPKEIEDATFIKIPIKSIACMSLTHVSFIEKLGQENSITSLSGCDYVSSPKIKSRIEQDFIKEAGQIHGINYEMLVDNKPSIVMSFGIDASSSNHINKMKTLGLDVVLNAEYMELHPLGKAEWVKFVGAFYDKDELADSVFNSIEKSYLELIDKTKNITTRPSVFAGMPWNGAWYVPGAKSFQAQLFNDAGAKYLWDNNDEKSSLIKSKEIVIDEAYEVDYWLNQNSFNSLSSIIGYDEKFKNFKAVKESHLFNNDNRLNENSGNDYWESGVVNPDIVLKDLIEIFHPNLLEHQLYYYRKLE